MFRFLVTLGLSVFVIHCTQAQTISGIVTDAVTALPIASANVSIIKNNKLVQQTSTNFLGRFGFAGIPQGEYLLTITHAGYEDSAQKLFISTQNNSEIQISLLPIPIQSQEIVIQAFRANPQTPVTQSNLSQREINAHYVGHDIPTLISTTPSINSYSDAGNGMGYSYFRLRGIDNTRINFTINGVPVNDPQNQGFFTNNFADIASSAQQIQIQRGVGTSNNGTASFGGSVNITTQNLTQQPEFTFYSGFGSFSSVRNTLQYQTGKLANGKLAFSARLSGLFSNGYRQNSATENQSYFLSGAWVGKKSLLKFNAWGGTAKSQLAYVGIDAATLKTNRTKNPLTAEERDQFNQKFYQLQYTYHLSNHLNVSASGYFVSGNAPHFDVRFNNYPYSLLNMPDTLFKGTDTLTATNFMARYRLRQQLVGGFASINYAKKKLTVNVGIQANSFVSNHFMQVAWAQLLPQNIEPQHTVYFNTGTKQEAGTFIKAAYQTTTKWLLFADVLVRYASWKYAPKAQQYLATQYTVEPMQWTFINPKIGARFAASATTALYANVGITGREPTRFDYLRDDLAWRDVKQNELKPERVYNAELGANINTKNLWLNVNGYFMQYKNQLANTGFLNPFGAAITQNTGKGYRAGIEIEAQWNISPRIALTHASNISKNNITSYTQYYEVRDEQGNLLSANPQAVTFNNVQPLLTPSVIINQGIQYSPLPYIQTLLNGRFVSKQYIDNTETESLSLPQYAVADASLTFNLGYFTKTGQQTISIRVNNITNTFYSPSGVIGTFNNTMVQNAQGKQTVTTPAAFFPAATTNFFVTLMMKF